MSLAQLFFMKETFRERVRRWRQACFRYQSTSHVSRRSSLDCPDVSRFTFHASRFLLEALEPRVLLSGTPDLVVTDLQAPTSAAVSSQMQVSWTVTNQGSSEAPADWYDSLYLSQDQVFDGSDTVVTYEPISAQTPLAAGASYTIGPRPLTIPNVAAGTWYLLAVTDVFTQQSETDETNNVRASGPITIGAPVNDAPAGTDATVTTNEDTAKVFAAADFGFSDASDGNSLAAVKISSLPVLGTLKYDGTAITAAQVTAGFEVLVADLALNKLTFAPAANANGAGYASFTFQVRDNGGTDNGGVDLDQSANTLTINVTAVNDAPVLAAIGHQTIDEQQPLTFTATATDADLPANMLTFSLANGASGTVPVGAAIDALTGAFTWTPTEAQGPGVFTFDVVVSDGSLTDFETITVTVGEVNLAPVLAAIGSQTVNEGDTLTFTATAVDSDVPTQPLTFSLSNAPVGATIHATTGVFTWTPTKTQGLGVYLFDVVVSDGALTDSQTITVTVNAVPVLAAIGNQTVDELQPLTFTATATDADLPANMLTFSLANGASGTVPVGAAIDALTGAFTWTPTEAQGPGVFTFDVVVSDGTATDVETIHVTVNEVNWRQTGRT